MNDKELERRMNEIEADRFTCVRCERSLAVETDHAAHKVCFDCMNNMANYHYTAMLATFRKAQIRAIKAGNKKMADIWAKNIAKCKARLKELGG